MYATEKRYVYFLFKYCLVRRKWGIQIRYISLRTNNLMTGKFVLCLNDNCCFYERLSPGRSKTYVTFDITEESCTWSLTASNVCDYWHFQSLVESSDTDAHNHVNSHVLRRITYMTCQTSDTYNTLPVLFSNLLPSSPVVALISSLLATLLYENQQYIKGNIVFM